MHKRKAKTIQTIRRIVLISFIVFMTWQAYMHQVKGGAHDGAASVHALCPYGGLESLYSLVTEGSFVSKIYLGTFALFLITVVLAIVLRRGFCGWICPFGGIQELFGLLGKKIFGKQLMMPGSADRPLRYLKYGVLVLTAGAAWITGSLWMSPYDPWAAYAHLGEGIPALLIEYRVGFIILIVSVAGSLLYDRFFCKYLCPMGAFLGILSKLSPHRIVRNRDVCIDCGLCGKVCPVNIPVDQLDRATTAECIECQLCTVSCPKEGALENRMGKRIVRPLVVGIIVLAVYFGGIGIARATGTYRLLPEPIAVGEIIPAEELRGFMTLREIADYRGLSLEEVYQRMEIPAEIPGSTQAKALADKIPGFSFDEAREKLE